MKHHTDDLIKIINTVVNDLSNALISNAIPSVEINQKQLIIDLVKLKQDLLNERELTIQKHKDVHGNGDNC